MHNERKWLRDKQAVLMAQAEGKHPGRAIGKILPDEANGHVLRTYGSDAESRWIWCSKCGTHTQTRIRALAEQCKGQRNTAQKRRLEGSRDPYTNRHNGAQPRDMAWSDVDAVRILEECSRLCHATEVDIVKDECSITHCVQCIGGQAMAQLPMTRTWVCLVMVAWYLTTTTYWRQCNAFSRLRCTRVGVVVHCIVVISEWPARDAAR